MQWRYNRVPKHNHAVTKEAEKDLNHSPPAPNKQWKEKKKITEWDSNSIKTLSSIQTLVQLTTLNGTQCSLRLALIWTKYDKQVTIIDMRKGVRVSAGNDLPGHANVWPDYTYF